MVNLAQKHFGGVAMTIQQTADCVIFRAPAPMKVASSAMINAGIGYYQNFVNRSVPKSYDERDPHAEYTRYLTAHGFIIEETVAMMTAVYAKHAVIRTFTHGELSLTVMVTAGLGNAVDITRALLRSETYHVGTINMWVLVDAKLSDEALLQGLISATEAKTKALFTENILDPQTHTLATGTSTDSVLVASSQQGSYQQYAGPITELGKLIGHGVYQTMIAAIRAYKKEVGAGTWR